MIIAAVGDIMPGGILNGDNQQRVSNEVLDVLNQADLRVGTLETAVGNTPDFNPEKMVRKADVIYTKDEDIKRLLKLGINIVSLANNHFYDLGEIGASHAIELLDNLGIMHCGAGKNIKEASAPAVVNHNGKTYAFLAFCDWREETVGWCPFASENKGGVNPMTEGHVKNEIKKYSKIYDYIIVIPHWGKEYRVAPTKEVYKMAKMMLNSGADIILGGHTHCIQPYMIIKDKKALVFSMGNFFFPDRLLIYPRSTYYPEMPLDIENLPVTFEYPRYVDCVTYKKWNEMARYGMIAQISINSNGKIGLKDYYVHLTAENRLVLFHDDIFYKDGIEKVYIALKTGVYPIILKLKERICQFKCRIDKFLRQ